MKQILFALFERLFPDHVVLPRVCNKFEIYDHEKDRSVMIDLTRPVGNRIGMLRSGMGRLYDWR